MIDASKLLSELQRLLKKLETDLRRRCEENPEVDTHARSEYDKARNAGRTSKAYEVWREEFITQVAVAWILGCVFVRFIEDNRLLDTPQQQVVWLAGPGARSQLARDRQTLYFREHPKESDREYLEHVFREIAKYPGPRELFDERHNQLWSLGVSGDGATELLNFWQQVDPTTGELRHDFTDAEWNTRFLGDLYQDLSEAARKKYALLQTPIFVEEFILDRTLTPAIKEFGYETVRLIDPTCGSGHFLLGAFERLFDLWVNNEPGINSRALAQRALDGVYGVDLNPFAVAIARFRLLIAALRLSEIVRLQDSPAFEINLALGDSLLHGPPRGDGAADQLNMMWSPMAHVYESEDKERLDRILVAGNYHAVVGNPPYIKVRDAALNKAYRERFGSCHKQYSLAVPFMERFFDLAVKGSNCDGAGYVGMITSNSFTKKEFGKKLIQAYIRHWNLTHVVDTSGAYIPGHATPTVILFGRNQKPISETIRTVMGIKGEPSTPHNPAHGEVWMDIVRNIDIAGTQTKYVSVADIVRTSFYRHPWTIGGGGAAEIKLGLDEVAETTLDQFLNEIGAVALTRADDVFVVGAGAARRLGIDPSAIRPYIAGEDVRDWGIWQGTQAIFPYDEFGQRAIEARSIQRALWVFRTQLRIRVAFGKSQDERGLRWYEYSMIFTNRLSPERVVVFANIATHNHFVLADGGSIYNAHAPIISFLSGTAENDYLVRLGLLNSSTGCFWIKQVMSDKGNGGIGGGIGDEMWERRYELDGTKLKLFPFPHNPTVDVPRAVNELSKQMQSLRPDSLSRRGTPSPAEWRQAKMDAELTLFQLIALQEELDWHCYESYGIIDDEVLTFPQTVPPVKLGERAFEIVMARKIAAGELQTAWFERHGSTPKTEIPSHWSQDYRQLVELRIETIEQNANIRLIEQPEYKRRWNTEPWDSQAERALREWLLNRLEEPRYWTNEELTTTARLADLVRSDSEFMQVAEMYRGRPDFDGAKLVAELVKSEAVPFLPVLRYKPSGLLHRAVWERTWELQRKEDEIDLRVVRRQSAVVGTQVQSTADNRSLTPDQAKQLKAAEVGDIPVPPKYKSADFLEQTFWRLRGKLDVPKEQFVSYPYCERDADQSLPIAWAGWDHLQQAKALANYYETVKATEGWGPTRLVPLLAGILELLPWLMQWHNELDPAFGIGMGDFFRGFVEEEARAIGLTLNRIREWTPVG